MMPGAICCRCHPWAWQVVATAERTMDTSAGPGVGMRVAGDAFLIAGLCGVLEDCGYVVNGVEVSGGDVHYQVVGLIVGQCQAAPVEAAAADGPLIAACPCVGRGQRWHGDFRGSQRE